eukprot:SAG11_NODE_343_length_10455_cov_7.072036_7_plen_209_part_00
MAWIALTVLVLCVRAGWGCQVGLPADHSEDLQVIHYLVGQQYRKHWDAYDPLSERGDKCFFRKLAQYAHPSRRRPDARVGWAAGVQATRRDGNRLVTALVYLSDMPDPSVDGGSTGFINLCFDVPAKKGRVLIFRASSEHAWCESDGRLSGKNNEQPYLLADNCHPGTRTLHPDSNHAGKPVLVGEKWAANLWCATAIDVRTKYQSAT